MNRSIGGRARAVVVCGRTRGDACIHSRAHRVGTTEAFVDACARRRPSRERSAREEGGRVGIVVMESSSSPRGLEAFRECIDRFYASHDAEAERALGAFVKSDDSWRMTLHVLERDDATPIEGVFCAQTLHALIRRCVCKETRTQASHAAFTEKDWVDLRARVLKLTAKFAMRSCEANAVDMRSTLTKLSLSLAALACKMNSWNVDAVVRDVVEYFSNDASTTNEAKLLCLCTFLAFIPEEATSRDLSLHPQRRHDVLVALRASACDVMDLLERLAANAGADVMLHKYILDALSAWADVADVTAKFPRVVLGGALQIIACADGHPSPLKQSAANAVKGALRQCVWTTRGELRETLATSMESLRRTIARPGGVSDESKTLLSEVFSSLALEALRNQKDATKNPLATGPNAEGDRVYVKHSEFKHLQRQQRKEQRKEQRLKTNIAVDIDEQVLLIALDSCSELLASGVSMASALEPWSKLAKAFVPDEVASSLRPVAARCMQAVVSYVCTQSRADLDDDQQKEEFADCLRDVISTVSIENILADFNENFHAELNAATEKGWKRIHARLYALLALTKSFQSGANQSSFTVLIETLCLLLVTDGVPVHVAESSCWVLAGLSKAIAALEDGSLLAVANVLIKCMTHVDFVVSRGAAVAMMKLSEHAAVRLNATDVPSRLLRLHAHGGPTPSTSLRLGQEHESTILLRILTFYVACGDDTNQAESACVMLAQQAITALSSCVDARRTDDYVKLLVDLDIVLRAMRRVCAHVGRPSDALVGLAKHAVVVVEKCASCTNELVFVEERFKIGWALRALVELSEHMRRDGVLERVVVMSVEAYLRNPALGFCYLQTLTISLEMFGDQTCRVTMGGRAFESTGGIVSEVVAIALPGCLEDQESWSGVFALARAALRSGCPALIPHLVTVTEASRRSLLCGCSDEPASVALGFATDLLCSSTMLRADLASAARAGRDVSAKSMNSGLGRLAAEISGESNNRGSRWNEDGAGEALADALARVMFVEGGVAVALMRAILEGGNGAMPPSMISDIAASLHLVWSTLGTEAFQRLFLLALGDEHDAFPKAKTTMEDKRLWTSSLTTDTARIDARIFKRLLKAFFGGKKVGSNL